MLDEGKSELKELLFSTSLGHLETTSTQNKGSFCERLFTTMIQIKKVVLQRCQTLNSKHGSRRWELAIWSLKWEKVPIGTFI